MNKATSGGGVGRESRAELWAIVCTVNSPLRTLSACTKGETDANPHKKPIPEKFCSFGSDKKVQRCDKPVSYLTWK